MSSLPKTRTAEYRGLPKPAVVSPDRKPQDTPLQAAQRRLQQIGHEAYQSTTDAKRRAIILAELEAQTINPVKEIAEIAQYVRARTLSNLKYMGVHEPEATNVVDIREQRPAAGKQGQTVATTALRAQR